MTYVEPDSDDEIDRLVGDHIRREIERTDTTQLLSRLRSMDERAAAPDAAGVTASTTASTSRTTRRWAQSITWAALTAGAVLVAFLGGRSLSPRSANAATVLRTVQSEHAGASDHCYRVQYAPDPRYWDGKNVLEGPSTSVLWTRGDRFFSDCTLGEMRLKIGREEDGTLWISPSPSKGIRFTNDESQLPKAVSLICAVNSMSVPQLMNDVLADFELHAEPAGKLSNRSRTIVWAKLKPGRSHAVLSDALLEIDPRSNVLTRLVLWMVRDGHPGGTVTYSLMKSSVQGDEQYRLLSHVEADARIESHTLPNPDDSVDLSPE